MEKRNLIRVNVLFLLALIVEITYLPVKLVK